MLIRLIMAYFQSLFPEADETTVIRQPERETRQQRRALLRSQAFAMLMGPRPKRRRYSRMIACSAYHTGKLFQPAPQGGLL